MRKIHAVIFALIFLCACEEENDVNNELNITLNFIQKSVSGIEPLNNVLVDVYPNPFQNVLNINFSGVDKAEIYIYNYEGSGKKFLVEDENNMQFDFSNEKEGAYIIEVLIDGTVFREFVIKGL